MNVNNVVKPSDVYLGSGNMKGLILKGSLMNARTVGRPSLVPRP